MSVRRILVPAAFFALATPAVAAGPLEVISEVRVERSSIAPDGSARITLVPPTRVVPGDRIVFTLRYRNIGARPLADLVLANPLPTGIAYRAPQTGTPVPDVSVDGRQYAPLATLRVGSRAAQASDIVAVRWRLAQPLAAGTGGSLAFAGVVK